MPAVWSAPVRFVECDQQGVAFNAHYLTWADEAVNAWWVAAGVPYGALAAWGVEYYVKATALDWSSSARYGDTVEVDAELAQLGRTSLTLALTVRVGERVCCTVRTTYVATAGGRPVPWPDEVRELVSAG
ncbi:thioesterase family protein [Modestobacter marinus]|uniref:4-hydroxybenzoyl-CoA thioesterase n=1 Tax=Modestobacter marinus TaxID=477641 RepID=A0A846LLK7_9ACTN|nr:thioesterase family protein [Modestobacter marinus]NIH66188.1 acyl-CoA thioester hydrolase [Modestobacter marinus]GGL61721.1 putative 4-hydroxybenzoyl-CoA thioesterase [Modestobacter marinus]